MNVVDISRDKSKENSVVRIAAYCRVSSDSADQLHSFAAQIRHYKDYERTHPQTRLIDVYADEGLSGLSMEKRDEFNRLIRDCQRGRIDRVIVKAVSRFARNTEELLEVLRMLKSINVSVFFEEQGIDTDKLNMEMLVTFPGMAAQQESVGISGNMRWSYRKRMESGEFNTTKPAFGYMLVDGQLIINETEAEIVRLVFNLCLSGLGMQKIANVLNAGGITSRSSNGKWCLSAIQYMLHNERYIGNALLQKKYSTDTMPFRKRRNHGEVTQYYVENSHPPIISHEIFEAVQQLHRDRRRTPTIRRGHYPLSGIVKCADCGRAFRRQNIAGTTYWMCSGKASGATDCSSLRVREDSVYETFNIMIYKLANYRKEILGSLIRQLEQLRNRASGDEARTASIDKQIADLAAQNLIVARLHTSGVLNAAEYTAQSSETGQKISKLRAERKRLLSDDENDQMIDSLSELDSLLEEYKPFTDAFDEGLLAQVVHSITVVSNAELRFTLECGLAFTETIPERGRCRAE